MSYRGLAFVAGAAMLVGTLVGAVAPSPASASGGDAWTAYAGSQPNSWKSIAYGNGVFVAVSTDGTNRVMTSSNGMAWTPRTAAAANSWYSMTFGNGQFVAVSPDGTKRIMTSPDGISWTAHDAPEATY